jgi:hypothetical protein
MAALLSCGLLGNCANASEPPTPIEIRVESVAPTGLRHPSLKWVAVGRMAGESEDGPQSLLLYMHSPVFKFGIAADELTGQRFRIVVLRREQDKILAFEVEHDAIAK